MLPRTPRSVLALALAALGLGATAPSALADAGDLDPTFAGGYVESLFEQPGREGHSVPTTTEFHALTLLGGPGLVAAGSGANAFALEARTQQGSLRPGFGRVTTTFPGYQGAAGRDMVRAGGGFVVVGSAGELPNQDLAIARYDSDGDLDPSFGGDGRVTLNFSAAPTTTQPDRADAVATLGDGSIIVGGTGAGNSVVVKLDPDGTPDEDFGDEGAITSDAGSVTDLAVQSDNRILAVDGDAVERFEPVNGSLDPTFGSSGRVNLEGAGPPLALQPDGRILVGPHRLLATGDPDPTFSYERPSNGDPILSRSLRIDSVAPQADGSILFGGMWAGDQHSGGGPMAVSRSFADGSLDKGFGSLGVAVTPRRAYPTIASAHALAVDSDGRIVIAGYDGYSGGAQPQPGLIARFEGGPSPASEPPDTSIEGFRVRGRHAFAAFTGASDRVPSGELGFECRVDTGPWRGCESPKQVRGRHRPGVHTFRVRSVDDQGDPDPSPASQRVHFPRG